MGWNLLCLNIVLTALANACVLNGMSSPEQQQTAYICIIYCIIFCQQPSRAIADMKKMIKG